MRCVLGGRFRAGGVGRAAPPTALAPAGHQRPGLLRPVPRAVVVRAAEPLRKHRLPATGLAADGARAGGLAPAAAAAQSRAQAAREIGHVDGRLQRALNALRDDLSQLATDLLAEVLDPFPHTGAPAYACHRISDR